MEQHELPDDDNLRKASRSVDAAAIRWGLAHPDEDVEHLPPSAPADAPGGVPNRHSASAEAASLRWMEQHPDEE
jgi:hypothetical protein